jgi:hypothetical protein
MATDPNLAPETHNSEQDDEQEQAQTVADQANALRRGDPTSSVKVGGGDVQDLVDHMRDMESSGRIDMGAYEGEENMDDNEDKYGEDRKPDPDLPSDGTY